MTTTTDVLPLEGMTVLDCSQWNSGPMATRVLADLGANVIKVESIQHVDPARLSAARFVGPEGSGPPPQFWERTPEWNYLNRNKRGITLDLSHEKGVDVFMRLVPRADVIIENLRPGVWEGFGLGYDRLQQANPSIIFVQMPGYGTTGPFREHPCWAVAVDQMAGFASYTGYEDGEPTSHALWADYANGLTLGFALMAALWHRRKTGQGQFVDLSQLEVATFMNPEALLDYQLNGRVWEPNGNNGRRGMAPHGCFPCQGEGQWIAIAVETDEEWRALSALIGEAEWLMDSRLASAAGRLEQLPAIHQHIAEWTNDRNKWELMHRLQRAGVPASAVVYGDEAQEDPHYRQRGLLETVHRPVVDEQTYAGAPFRYAKTPIRSRRPAPTLGQHNAEVLKTMAGLSDDELRQLEADHIIGSQPLHH